MNQNDQGPSDKKPQQSVNDFFKDLIRRPEAAITYALLLTGIILLFFDYILLGSLIVGLIAGYHFAPEIMFYLRNLSNVFAGQDQVKYVVLTAVIVALFIAVPGIFIGAIAAAVAKQSIKP